MIKTLKKKLSKGFTLVELIVVIAIVAILAAVSVVSYVAFINSANKSADEQTVTQVNKALQADEILNGKCSTPTDAIKVAAEAGFLVEKLTPTSKGYDYAWNSETNRFNILEKDNVVFPLDHGNSSKFKLYRFVSTAEQIGETFSTYLKADFTGTLPSPITKGLDVGEVNTITAIKYENATAQNVIIRTNGGELTIKSPLDTVSHYGAATKTDIIAIAKASYHEYGKVNLIQIASGRVVIENSQEANVGTIFITKAATGSSNEGVQIEANKEQEKEVIVKKEAGIPDSTVETIKVNGEEIKNDTSKVDVVTEEEKENVITGASLFAGGMGTEAEPYLISNREHIQNI